MTTQGQTQLSRLAKAFLCIGMNRPGLQQLTPFVYNELQTRNFIYTLLLPAFDEQSRAPKKAVEIDPLSGYAHTILALTYVLAGRGDEAVRAARAGVELGQSFFTTGPSRMPKCLKDSLRKPSKRVKWHWLCQGVMLGDGSPGCDLCRLGQDCGS